MWWWQLTAPGEADVGALSGTVALITGAGRYRGIGRAVALRLAADGADMAIAAVARDPATFPEAEQAMGWRGAESVADEVRALGRRAIAIDCDVTDRTQVEFMVAQTIDQLGGLGAVVNNAGLASNAGDAPIVDVDDKTWARTVDVNLNGVYLVSKCAARAMVQADKGGAIVNVSSTAGRMGMANYGAYCATKFGVIGLTQQMALELAPHGIRVNCVCPGSTDTDMMDATFQRAAGRVGASAARIRERAMQGTPLGRQAEASEQAGPIAFLIGRDAAFVTGQTLNVNGGARMD